MINIKRKHELTGDIYSHPVRAIKRSKSAFGIFIHKSTDYPERWSISHIKTGYSIAHITDLESAKAIFKLIEKLDWKFSNPIDVPQPTKDAMKLIYQRYQYGRFLQVTGYEPK